MIEKGLYPYKGIMPEFLTSSIRAFKLKIFFQRVTVIRLDMVKLFHKGYINKEENYLTIVKELFFFFDLSYK